MFTVVYLVQITCIFKGKKNRLEAIFSCIFNWPGRHSVWNVLKLQFVFSPCFPYKCLKCLTIKKGHWKSYACCFKESGLFIWLTIHFTLYIIKFPQDILWVKYFESVCFPFACPSRHPSPAAPETRSEGS